MGVRRFLRQVRFGTDLLYRLHDRLMFPLRQLAPHHALRRPADDNRPSPFFIVGSGRSGNTLLRAILAGHGNLAIPPESYVLGGAVRDYRRFGFLKWSELLRVVLGRFAFHPQFSSWETDLREVCSGLSQCPREERSLARIFDEMYRAYARRHMPGADRWGDKTPANVYHLPRIEAVFPAATYVHMIRDGRDVVASYLDTELYASVEEACERWLESVELVRSFSSRILADRYLEVRYERLVREPVMVTREVCEHLGVAYEPGMLEHRKRVDELGDTHANHHAGLARPISDRSVGSWRERLDARQRDVVGETLEPTLSALGYGAG